jgi:hypothetical protein
MISHELRCNNRNKRWLRLKAPVWNPSHRGTCFSSQSNRMLSVCRGYPFRTGSRRGVPHRGEERRRRRIRPETRTIGMQVRGPRQGRRFQRARVDAKPEQRADRGGRPRGRRRGVPENGETRGKPSPPGAVLHSSPRGCGDSSYPTAAAECRMSIIATALSSAMRTNYCDASCRRSTGR